LVSNFQTFILPNRSSISRTRQSSSSLPLSPSPPLCSTTLPPDLCISSSRTPSEPRSRRTISTAAGSIAIGCPPRRGSSTTGPDRAPDERGDDVEAGDLGDGGDGDAGSGLGFVFEGGDVVE